MTKTLITMDINQWAETFKPIQNHITADSSFGGEMFETFGADLEYVLTLVRQGFDKAGMVWTYADGDGGTFIVEGYQLVNRIGYFITEVPAKEGFHYEIPVSKDEDSE